MTKKDLQNLIFDSSALFKFLKGEKGSNEVDMLLQKCLSGDSTGFISTLTAYEIMIISGIEHEEEAIRSIAFFEKFCSFVPPNLRTSKEAALLKLKNKYDKLSTVDALILQSGIELDALIITCDKAWAEVIEANVKVV